EADPEIRTMLLVILERNGARVTAAASAAEAVERLSREHPDVLVSDITPGEDGYALIRRIRSLAPECGGRVPAAALGGHAATQDEDCVLGAGYQLHLTKPVDARALISAVAKLAAVHGSDAHSPEGWRARDE